MDPGNEYINLALLSGNLPRPRKRDPQYTFLRNMPPKQRLCPDCRQTFKGKSKLKAHMKTAGHGLLCPVSGCNDRRWADRSTVMQHCKAVHRMNAESVRHMMGDRTFQVKSSPKVTTSVSQCPLCLASCFDIPTHFQYSHPAFICELCEDLFVSESQRRQHLCHSVPSASELPEPSTWVGSGFNEPMDSNIPFFSDSDSEVGTETKNSSGRDWSREKHIPPPK
ncbi:hypothetical protein BC629DRAFT_246424 [Irpex lacteus]|nr:hypothetical protein BC629DRAFT_246424 [Irpex lacteus]